LQTRPGGPLPFCELLSTFKKAYLCFQLKVVHPSYITHCAGHRSLSMYPGHWFPLLPNATLLLLAPKMGCCPAHPLQLEGTLTSILHVSQGLGLLMNASLCLCSSSIQMSSEDSLVKQALLWCPVAHLNISPTFSFLWFGSHGTGHVLLHTSSM
jgi:hypothetical protein